MRKLLVFIILLLVIGGGYLLFTQRDYADVVGVTTDLSSKSTTESSPAANTGVIKPATLIIPKLGVRADVEYVGMDEKGNMDVPKNDENVAWFELGYTPGSAGNAVLAGHLDTKTGSPAVFYKLETLEKGDTIRVVGNDERELTFVVTGKETYAADDFPLVQVFGPADTPRLNLITCEGSFNSSNRSYSHRTVIYTTLVD